MGEMRDPFEERLADAFRALSEVEGRRPPDFREMVSGGEVGSRMRPAEAGGRRGGRRRLWTLGGAVGLAAAAVLAALLLVRSQDGSHRFEVTLEEARTELALGSWEAPSDFLMDFPGRRLYREVPAVPDARSWPGVAEAGPTTRNN